MVEQLVELYEAQECLVNILTMVQIQACFSLKQIWQISLKNTNQTDAWFS